MMISFIYFRWRRSCSFTVFYRQACSICSICFNEVHQETQHSAKLSHFLTRDEKQHWGVKPLSRETWNEHTAQCQPSSARIRPNCFFTEISPLQSCSSVIALPKSPIICTLMSSRITCVWTTLNCLAGVLPLKFERFCERFFESAFLPGSGFHSCQASGSSEISLNSRPISIYFV